MTDTYGKRIGLALRAVAQLHQDTGRLFADLDRVMIGWKSIFGSTSTNKVDRRIGLDSAYMAEGLYRYYGSASHANIVRSVTACFIEASIDEPIPIVAELKYANSKPASPSALCKQWDTWDLYFAAEGNRTMHQILEFEKSDVIKQMTSGRLIAVPLFEIAKVEDVAELMKQVAA